MLHKIHFTNVFKLSELSEMRKVDPLIISLTPPFKKSVLKCTDLEISHL